MIFLWYPKCSTCIKAKKYLDSKGINYTLRSIVDDNPSKEELEAWLNLSNKDLKKFFNTSGLLYKEMNLKDKISSLSKDEMLDLLSSSGKLIKRPLLVGSSFVLIGFKEEEYSQLV